MNLHRGTITKCELVRFNSVEILFRDRFWLFIFQESILKTKSKLKNNRLKLTRRERLKSALYLRLKKRKTFFLEKNLKFSKIFLFCRTVPKNVKRGTFFDL